MGATVGLYPSYGPYISAQGQALRPRGPTVGLLCAPGRRYSIGRG